MTTENNAPSLKQCIKDFARDFRTFRKVEKTITYANVKDLFVFEIEVHNLAPYVDYPKTNPTAVIGAVERIADRMLELLKDERLANSETFGIAALASERMREALTYDNPLQWPTPVEEKEMSVDTPVNELEKLLKDAMTFLAGDAAEAVDQMVERVDDTDDDELIAEWDSIEAQRVSLVERLKTFVESTIKQPVIIEVDGGVSSVESAPSWVTIKTIDRDTMEECLQCGEYINEQPCEHCGWSESDDWDDDTSDDPEHDDLYEDQ